MYRHSRKEAMTITEELQISKSVLESLDREIAFYRRRSGQVFFFSLLIEVLILTGREKVVLPATWALESCIVYTTFFVIVAAVGIFLGIEYHNRIHILRDSRDELVRHTGYSNVYPSATDQRISEIQVLCFVYIFLSSAGISFILANAYPNGWFAWAVFVGSILFVAVAAVLVLRKSRKSAEVGRSDSAEPSTR